MTQGTTGHHPSSKTVMCLFAHPDDESYSVAGTVAMCAKNNAQVTMVYCTRGEAGPNFCRDRRPDQALADIRTREMERACRIMGTNPPLFLDLPDGKLSQVEPSRAMTMIFDILTAVKPDLVLGLGPDGAYGHLDHITCYKWMERLMTETPVEKRPRCMWSVFPKGAFSGLYKKLSSLEARVFLAALDSDDLGVEREKIDLQVNVSGFVDIKKQVMACHQSQLLTGKIQSFPLYSSVQPFLHKEMFVCAHGLALRNGATSPLEGL